MRRAVFGILLALVLATALTVGVASAKQNEKKDPELKASAKLRKG